MKQLEEDEIQLWSTYVPRQAGQEVQKILNSKWINTGKQEKLFRRKAREQFQLPYCVATSSGTAALRAALAALGVGPGDEVITTPMTFIATNTAILEQGAVPVFVDIQYETLNMDPSQIEEQITNKTKAILCVHYGGIPCDMDEIRHIGRAHNLPILEDAAHAMGSRYKNRPIGSTGDAVTFSFQCVKVVTCGDGGLIATSNPDIYKRLKKCIWYGVDRERRKTDSIDPMPDAIDTLGFKYNMNDITATLGIVGLDHLESALLKRKTIGETYRRELAACKRIQLLQYPRERTPNYQIFPLHVDNREQFAQYMQRRGIKVNVNNRRNDRYSIFGGLRDLPNTAQADEDTILIPLHADLSEEQVKKIIETIREYDKT